MKKILVAVDGTKHSAVALEQVKMLDFDQIEEIWVLSVIDMALPLAHDIYTGMVINSESVEKAAHQVAEQHVENAKATLQKFALEAEITISKITCVGSPESQIVEQAEKLGADLIVMGSHGYNGWERLLLGSVSDSVTHHAHCSVMIVR